MKYEKDYFAIHAWLVRHHGKASICEFCKKKDKKKYEWALIKDKKHERKRENYMQLCSSCHSIYDGKMVILTKINLKKVVATKGKIKIKFSSITEAVELLKILNSSISNNLRGHTKTAGGYKWEYIKNKKT